MNYFKNGMMKRSIIIISLAILASLQPLFCQGQTNAERLNAFKIAFFTRKLNLTSTEAEKFWPVYNDYTNKKNQIQIDRAELMNKVNQNASRMSDKEITEAGDKLIASIMEETKLAETLHRKLKEILPPIKVLLVYQTENQYKAQLLRQLNDDVPEQPLRQRR